MQYGDNIIETSLREVLVSGETEVRSLLLMDRTGHRANEITEPPPILALSLCKLGSTIHSDKDTSNYNAVKLTPLNNHKFM